MESRSVDYLSPRALSLFGPLAELLPINAVEIFLVIVVLYRQCSMVIQKECVVFPQPITYPSATQPLTSSKQTATDRYWCLPDELNHAILLLPACDRESTAGWHHTQHPQLLSSLGVAILRHTLLLCEPTPIQVSSFCLYTKIMQRQWELKTEAERVVQGQQSTGVHRSHTPSVLCVRRQPASHGLCYLSTLQLLHVSTPLPVLTPPPIVSINNNFLKSIDCWNLTLHKLVVTSKG